MVMNYRFVMAGVGLLAMGTALSGCTQPPAGYKLYGASLKRARTIPAEEVFENPGAYDGKTVRLAGTIDAVCAKRKILRARFVESGECTRGFFVPRDAAGHNVILEGTIRQEELSEAMARHFLEDGGASEAEINEIVGPQKALLIVCTGVAIEGGDSLSEPLQPAE
jgi:starvation-inducible outer membrane lipoprotein